VSNFSWETIYWIKRWADCYPQTYPSELYLEKSEVVTKGWWIFKKSYLVTHAYCARCGEILETGHMCEDIAEYLDH
jgi:hypothetical protein